MASTPNRLHGFFPGFRHFNLTVVILGYLKLSRLLKVVSRVSRAANTIVFSSLIWQNLKIDKNLAPMLPNFAAMNHFVSK